MLSVLLKINSPKQLKLLKACVVKWLQSLQDNFTDIVFQNLNQMLERYDEVSNVSIPQDIEWNAAC